MMVPDSATCSICTTTTYISTYRTWKKDHSLMSLLWSLNAVAKNAHTRHYYKNAAQHQRAPHVYKSLTPHAQFFATKRLRAHIGHTHTEQSKLLAAKKQTHSQRRFSKDILFDSKLNTYFYHQWICARSAQTQCI